VDAAVTSIRALPDSVIATVGGNASFSVMGDFADNVTREITSHLTGTTYTTAAPGIATVSADGIVHGVSVGATTVTITNAVTAQVNVSVLKSIPNIGEGEGEGEGEALTVDFTASPTWGKPPLRVEFSARVTGSTESVDDWIWDFGDGMVIESKVPTITHFYNDEGRYWVSLTVITSTGDTATVTKENLILVTQALALNAAAQWVLMVLIIFAGAVVFLRTRQFTGIGN
jgi:PKD repeat protein